MNQSLVYRNIIPWGFGFIFVLAEERGKRKEFMRSADRDIPLVLGIFSAISCVADRMKDVYIRNRQSSSTFLHNAIKHM